MTEPLTGAEPTPDPETLTTIAGACRSCQRLDLTYADRDGNVNLRRVERYGLVPTSRRWYLLARDLHRDDWRIFRVDRIEAVHMISARFTPREPPDATAFVAAAITAGVRRRSRWAGGCVLARRIDSTSPISLARTACRGYLERDVVARRWPGYAAKYPTDVHTCGARPLPCGKPRDPDAVSQGPAGRTPTPRPPLLGTGGYRVRATCGRRVHLIPAFVGSFRPVQGLGPVCYGLGIEEAPFGHPSARCAGENPANFLAALATAAELAGGSTQQNAPRTEK